MDLSYAAAGVVDWVDCGGAAAGLISGGEDSCAVACGKSACDIRREIATAAREDRSLCEKAKRSVTDVSSVRGRGYCTLNGG